MANAKKSSKKRSRDNNDEEEKKSYYERLLYQCRKDLHKQAKVVKGFETQKMVRRCNSTNNEQQHVEKRDELKAFESLEPVIQECFRRLGILALNPDAASCTAPTVEQSPCWVTERILEHKRMRESIDKWHSEVTNYRRWCLKQQERKERRQLGTKSSNNDKQKPGRSNLASSEPSSVFVQLGGEDQDNEGEDDQKKKNRKGQRARRAKALAVEARQQGRTLTREESLNWRKKKPRMETEDIPKTDDADANEHLHPSWQARKEQKQTIVPFQGKKITF